MTAGERIRKLRIEKGMTQDELAKKLGYKSRTSVNKVETCRDLSLKIVESYAKALDTTTSYLLGWEEFKNDPKTHTWYSGPDPEDEQPGPLSDDERSIVLQFRDLSRERQLMIVDFIEYFWKKEMGIIE